jgi:hypothetical protein
MAKRGKKKAGRAAKKRKAAPKRKTAKKMAKGKKAARKPAASTRKRASKTSPPRRSPAIAPGGPGPAEPGALEGEVLPGMEGETP